jgi:hypothetical protein
MAAIVRPAEPRPRLGAVERRELLEVDAVRNERDPRLVDPGGEGFSQRIRLHDHMVRPSCRAPGAGDRIALDEATLERGLPLSQQVVAAEGDDKGDSPDVARGDRCHHASVHHVHDLRLVLGERAAEARAEPAVHAGPLPRAVDVQQADVDAGCAEAVELLLDEAPDALLVGPRVRVRDREDADAHGRRARSSESSISARW